MPPRQRHRRLFFGLALALAAGAIITALVAWACVGLTIPQGTIMLAGNPVVSAATLRGGPNIPSPPYTVIYDSARLTILSSSVGMLGRETSSFAGPTVTYAYDYRWHSGWPFAALHARARGTSNQPFTSRPRPPPSLTTGIPARSFSPSLEVRYPLLPLFPGFLYDTLLYAALLYTPLATFSHLRARYLRARRGHCPRCHYDLRGLLTPTCPECGDPGLNNSPAAERRPKLARGGSPG